VRLAFLIYCFRRTRATSERPPTSTSSRAVAPARSAGGGRVSRQHAGIAGSVARDDGRCPSIPGGRLFPSVPLRRRDRKRVGSGAGPINALGRDILIHGVDLGNVLLCVQPTFGYEGDPMRMLMPREARRTTASWALHLARQRLRRRRAGARGHARRARIHAWQAGGPERKLLADRPDRRIPKPLPVQRQQPVGRQHRAAPLLRDAEFPT